MTMEKKEEKLNHILTVTAGILGAEGADKLSMRKVAKAADLSLSNLQYYYKDKNILLIATTQYYFEACKQEFTRTLTFLKSESSFTRERFLEKALHLLLVNGKENSQSIMFQEIWALSSRNKELEKAVEIYYRDYCIWSVDLFASFFKHPERLVSLIIPFAEGYAIMGAVLPLDKQTIIQLLVNLVLHMEE
jgi:AcrR family transcriptional regulator